MKADYLKLASFVAYLASWVLFLIGGIVLSIPWVERSMRPRAEPARRDAHALSGLVLQVAAAIVTTLLIPKGRLAVGSAGQVVVLILAPASALLFCLTAGIARSADPDELVTRGPYAAIRHPLYLSIYGMLVSTTLLMASPLAFAVSSVLYLAGTELRIAAEERGLEEKFGQAWRAYRDRVRVRYLPMVR